MMQIVNQFAWPQWTAIVWLLLGLIAVSSVHGKQKRDRDGHVQTYNFPQKFILTIIIFLVLIAGGFFH